MEKKKFYDYYVYEDGRVYSNLSNKFLKGDNVKGYIQYSLSLNKKKVRMRAHRLVAMLFVENTDPENNIMVNHIDGNKLNNHYSNLEWCTAYHNNKHARDTGLNNVSESNSKRWKDEAFRKKTSKHISEGIIAKGCFKGKKNPRFRYEIYQNGKEVDKQYVMELLNIAESTLNTKIREYCQGKIYNRFIENDIIIVDTYNKGQQTIES